MANENWEQEKTIIDAFKAVQTALFELERRLTPGLRQQLFSARCQVGEVENNCRFQVREIARDGSTVWASEGQTPLRQAVTESIFNGTVQKADWPLVRKVPPTPVEKSTVCVVPPEGWSCSRGAGHPGPCAAKETE